ncbi:MAG: amidohydrolase [Rhodospirillaceae bacterium]|mgnify:CR=1 FL=1|nr:amidohydrolase [Rhodospirillaceae bacterium]
MNNSVQDILEPELPIIDAHHHLIDVSDHSYDIEDYSLDCSSGHLIKGSVYIEVRQNYRISGPDYMRPIGETEHVAALSQPENIRNLTSKNSLCAGIVGFAELELGDKVSDVLDAHIEAGDGRFRGIRRGVYWSSDSAIYDHVSIRPPPQLMLSKNFRLGFSHLAPRNLSFDAVLFHPQLPELAALAKAFPDTVMILNHIGFKLGVGDFCSNPDQVFSEWRKGLEVVAECPNVMVKIGGLGMKIWGFKFHESKPSYQSLAAEWRPIVEVGIETFGVDRCIFESNYPVDAATTNFVSLWNALKFLTKDYSASEKRKLFFENANRVYRLGL